MGFFAIATLCFSTNCEHTNAAINQTLDW